MAKPNKEEPGASSEKVKPGEEAVQTGGWDQHTRVRSRAFNGPAGLSDLTRISMTKEAYADLIGHAKESLDREICGILLGDLCEDDNGLFLDVRATIRGSAAKTGGTHVTFTQETWNEIHAAKEERYPKLQIVGWYHSHPGFGVEFSDMDIFIQKNFFGGPSQIAFVTDPLGGQEAIVANLEDQIVPVKRFSVDGRERKCYVPESAAGSDQKQTEPAVSSQVARNIEELQDRTRQLTEALEKMRGTFYNFLTFLGMLIALCFLMGTGYSIWRAYWRPIVPPEEMDTNAIPIMVNGKPAVVALSVKTWAMTPEVQEQIWQFMLAQHKAAEEAADAATRPSTTSGPAQSRPASAPKAP